MDEDRSSDQLSAGATPPVPGQYFEATLHVPATGVVGHALNYEVTLRSVYSRRKELARYSGDRRRVDMPRWSSLIKSSLR